MTDIAGFINGKMDEAGIPYEYGEWTQLVEYPYFVGNLESTEWRYEDACTTATFTIDGWERGSKAKLTVMTDTINKIFEDLQEVKDGECYFVYFNNAQFIPSGEADLFRVTITLNIKTWKGD